MTSSRQQSISHQRTVYLLEETERKLRLLKEDMSYDSVLGMKRKERSLKQEIKTLRKHNNNLMRVVRRCEVPLEDKNTCGEYGGVNSLGMCCNNISIYSNGRCIQH